MSLHFLLGSNIVANGALRGRGGRLRVAVARQRGRQIVEAAKVGAHGARSRRAHIVDAHCPCRAGVVRLVGCRSSAECVALREGEREQVRQHYDADAGLAHLPTGTVSRVGARLFVQLVMPRRVQVLATNLLPAGGGAHARASDARQATHQARRTP